MNFHNSPNVYVGEVTLKVEKLERSLSFYREVIGFKVLKQTEKEATLTTNGHTPLLTIVQPAGVIPKETRTTGLYHFALLLPERGDLGSILNHFLKLNISLGSSDHLVSEALYLSDPDGNGIEIYWDRPASLWSWKDGSVKMTVDPLDAKGILAESEGKPWSGLPEGTVMGHIHLHVSDLQKAEEFYIKGLGFESVSRLGNQALFISTGGYHHHIGLNTWNGEGAPIPKENSVGLNYYTLQFPTAKERNQIIHQLNSIGAYVSEENGKVLTKDPSGNRIYLTV